MKRYTLEEKSWLKNNYSILGSHECAKILGRPLASIRITANNMGCYIPLELRNNLHSKTLIKKFTPSILPSTFKDVNTKETAYILGLLWADGWITYKDSYSVDIKLISKDFDNIEWIFFKLGEWKRYIRKETTGHKQTTSLRLSGKELVDYLISLDYHTKYQSAIKVINTIPEELKCYWWRGYVDGDGYIHPNHPYRLGFSGPHNQDWSFLPKEYNFRKNIVIGKHSFSNAILIRKKEIYDFGSFIWKTYEDDKIGLKRKYDKFLFLKNSYDTKQ
jgi:hypothetical protein